MASVARKATYNPRTKKFFGFPDDYVARPGAVPAARPLEQASASLRRRGRTCARRRPKLKAIGHPIGIGMSNEIDSNMANIAS